MQEMNLFENGGIRGFNLQCVYDFLNTIPPTSVEAERCFSSAGMISTKFRTRLRHESLDGIVFLRNFLK